MIRVPQVIQRSIRPAIFAGALLAAAAAGAVAIIVDPLLGIAAGVVCLAGIFAFYKLTLTEQVLSVGLLGGVTVLGYGFANVGIRTGGVPLPATELMLLPLVALALLDRTTRPPIETAIPLTLFLAMVVLRLVADYPHFGTLAIRDATTGIEMLTLLAGYRAVVRDGLEVWLKRLSIIFVIVLAYGATYPWRVQIGALGPTVGLQRQVNLLGSMAGVAFASAAAGLWFASKSSGWRRAAPIAWTLGLIAIFQERSLYILFPAALIFVGWRTRKLGKIGLAVLAALPVIGMALYVVAALGVQGRLGPVNPSFYLTHAETLLGGAGPGAGSIHDRQRWARLTLQEITNPPVRIFTGVGFGPDLAFGFRKEGEISVRKPHDDFLEMFARMGIIGLGLFLWLLASIVIPVFRTARGPASPEQRMCSWTLGAMGIYLGGAAVQPLLAFPYGTIPLFFWLGMALALSTRSRALQQRARIALGPPTELYDPQPPARSR